MSRQQQLLDSVDRVLWQAYAHLYDGLLDVLTYRDMIGQVASLADCSGRTVLDVGAGTGNVTQALLQAGAAQVTSVDSSGNMLRIAHRKLASEVAAGKVTIVNQDAVMVLAGLPGASIERIVAVNVLYALPDRVQFFQQAGRVLAPGGFIIAAHTTRPGSGPIVRDQFRRVGWRGVLRPRLLAIALVDLIIDGLARGGRYDFAAFSVLSQEAAQGGLARTRLLGRCYGGPVDGVNELLRISAD